MEIGGELSTETEKRVRRRQTTKQRCEEERTRGNLDYVGRKNK